MPRIISATENSVHRHGDWSVIAGAIRHNRLTNHLDDFAQLNWRGTGLSAELSTTTGRKIAVVIKLDGQPIAKEIAGKDIQWGEGQSFVFVEQPQSLQLVTDVADQAHYVQLFTRSDKLVCHNFIISEKE